MKVFEGVRSIRKAIEHSLAGGQALHVWEPHVHKSAPKVFKRYKLWAHLFDHDVERLKATAKTLGVNILHIEREGQTGQHIDLCGAPLLHAIELAEKESKETS